MTIEVDHLHNSMYIYYKGLTMCSIFNNHCMSQYMTQMVTFSLLMQLLKLNVKYIQSSKIRKEKNTSDTF